MSETKQRIYMALVVGAIAFWAYNNLMQTSPKSAALSQPQVATSQRIPSITKAPDLYSIKNKSWGADPFYKSKKQSSNYKGSNKANRGNKDNHSAAQYKLKAIIFDKDDPSAFLNGQIVRPGDKINGATVLNISKSSVILKKNGHNITITVKRG